MSGPELATTALLGVQVAGFAWCVGMGVTCAARGQGGIAVGFCGTAALFAFCALTNSALARVCG